MNKRIVFLERMWLFFGIIALILAVVESIRKPINQIYPLFIISAISFFMFSLRRTIRKKMNSQ